NCVFQDTQRGIRIKTTRGRGNVVEDVQVTNIVVRDLKAEAVALDMFYTAAPPEPVSDRTPHVRNVHISGVTGTARGAGVLFGLDEARLDDVTLTDIDVTAETGIAIRNADVVTLPPHAATPVVTLVNVSHAFLQGCFAQPGTDMFLSVRGRDTKAIVLGENDLAG